MHAFTLPLSRLHQAHLPACCTPPPSEWRLRLSGFGAAKHLSEQGYRVTLLEASANPGGLATGWRTASGKEVEAGMKGFWYVLVCVGGGKASPMDVCRWQEGNEGFPLASPCHIYQCKGTFMLLEMLQLFGHPLKAALLRVPQLPHRPARYWPTLREPFINMQLRSPFTTGTSTRTSSRCWRSCACPSGR